TRGRRSDLLHCGPTYLTERNHKSMLQTLTLSPVVFQRKTPEPLSHDFQILARKIGRAGYTIRSPSMASGCALTTGVGTKQARPKSTEPYRESLACVLQILTSSFRPTVAK